MVTTGTRGFGAALLGGLAELGPVDPFSGDLSLELGISLWLRRSGTRSWRHGACCSRIRRLIIEVCGLDRATEPVSMVGRSPRLDVVNLVAYVGDLLRRASSDAACSVRSVVDRVVVELPEHVESTLGA